MRTICSILLLTVSSSARAEEKIDAKLLVGKWELVLEKGDDKRGRMTVEYTADGNVTAELWVGDVVEKVEGTYKVEGNKLLLTSKSTDKDNKSVRIIHKLTADEMVQSDEGEPKEMFRRLKK